MSSRSPAQDIPDIYWEQAARELDFCTCRKCQVSHHHVEVVDDVDVVVDYVLVDDDHNSLFCQHGIYQQLDNNLDSEKSTQMTNDHNSRPSTSHTMIILIFMIISTKTSRIIIPVSLSAILLQL